MSFDDKFCEACGFKDEDGKEKEGLFFCRSCINDESYEDYFEIVGNKTAEEADNQ